MPENPHADAQAVLLLCAPLVSAAEATSSPLTPTEWHGLARRLQEAGRRPGELLAAADDLPAALPGLDEPLAERLARLLARGGQLALEQERLASSGIRLLACVEEEYPPALRERLEASAPPVLFAAGPPALGAAEGLAVVGSRAVDEAGGEFAAALGRLAAAEGLVLVSGAAKGVDRLAMHGALAAGGTAVGVLGDSLERFVRQPDVRRYLLEETLLLLSPHHPRVGFSPGLAMARNRLIYALAGRAVVVACEEGKGGTWTGAVEALRRGWASVAVRADDGAPPGNAALLPRGAQPLPPLAELEETGLAAALAPPPAAGETPAPAQLTLFDREA